MNVLSGRNMKADMPTASGVAEGAARGSRWLVVVLLGSAVAALVSLAAGLLAGGGGPKPVAAGLPDPGAVTAYGLPLARLLFDLAAVATVGLLVAGVVLVPAQDGRLMMEGRRAVRLASGCALGWLAATLTTAVLSLSNLVGLPAVDVLSPDLIRTYAATAEGRALGAVLALCVAVAVAASRAATTARGGLALVAAVAALLPTTFTGHSATSADHGVATSAIIVHVIAASVWVGGLLGVAVALRNCVALPSAVARFSRLALACYLLLGMSGVLSAWTRLGGTSQAWSSPYATVLAAKAVALLLLGWFGWQHRRRTIPAIAAGRPRAFLSLASVELTIMAATVGLAVALSRTPPPVTGDVTDGAPVTTAPGPHGEHVSFAADVPPLTLQRLFTEWQPDALVISIVGIALAGYVLGMRTIRVKGQRWPTMRAAAFGAGCLVAVVLLSAGFASYGRVVLSAHIAQIVGMALVVPALLATGAPLTLALRALPASEGDRRGAGHLVRRALASRSVRTATDPVNGVLLAAGTLFVMYVPEVFEIALQNYLTHLLLNLATLLVGVVLLWPLLGVDPVPEPRTMGHRTIILVCYLAVFASLGVALLGRGAATEWFSAADLAWVDPRAEERRAAGILWASVQVLGPVLYLVMYLQNRAGHYGRLSRPSEPASGPGNGPALSATHPVPVNAGARASSSRRPGPPAPPGGKGRRHAANG